MKKNRLKIIAVVIFILVVFSVSFVYAQAPYTPEESQRSGSSLNEASKETEFAKELGLTQEQLNQLKAHRQANQEKMKELKGSLKDSRAELKAELEATELNEAAVNKATSKIKELSAKLLDCRVEGITYLKKTLTPEQFAKLQEKTKEKIMELKSRRNSGKFSPQRKKFMNDSSGQEEDFNEPEMGL